MLIDYDNDGYKHVTEIKYHSSSSSSINLNIHQKFGLFQCISVEKESTETWFI